MNLLIILYQLTKFEASSCYSFRDTGKLRYLEFQGNGENTSSFPKFKIANYDVMRIHVHEQNFVHFRLKTLSAFVKSALLQNICMFVIRCVLPTLFYPQISGSDYGPVSTTNKTFGPFSGWDLVQKVLFSSLNVNKENPVEILPTYAIAHSPIVHYIRYIN